MNKVLAHCTTLKARIATLMVLLVMLAAAMVTYVSLQVGENKMRAVIGSQQYAMLSSAAAYIEQDLQAKKTILMLTGEQLAQGDYSMPMALQRFLLGHAVLRDQFFNVVGFDPDGNVIANLKFADAIGRGNFSQRAYIADTLRLRAGLISQPFRSTLSQQPVVVITEPVFDAHGTLRYILTGSIDLQRPQFADQLRAPKLGASGYLFMLTRDGVIIHHPDHSRILHNVMEESGGAVPSTLKAMQGFEGWIEGPTKRGVRALIAYKQLRSTGWVLGAVYPVHEAFAPLIELRTDALLASAVAAVVAGLIGWLAILQLLRPLGTLRQQVAAMSAGSDNIAVFDNQRQDEFGELSRAFFLLSQQRRNAEVTLLALSRTDPLTGIPNRREFDDVLQAALGRASRNAQPVALAYLDIDAFKQINDTHGHGVGDAVLIEFATRLRSAVRSTDTVARLAGDEFVVIFENLAGASPQAADHGLDEAAREAAALSGKILASIRAPLCIGHLTLNVTTSIGIALTCPGCAGAVALMAASDQALYAAKDAGRDGYALRVLA